MFTEYEPGEKPDPTGDVWPICGQSPHGYACTHAPGHDGPHQAGAVSHEGKGGASWLAAEWDDEEDE